VPLAVARLPLIYIKHTELHLRIVEEREKRGKKREKREKIEKERGREKLEERGREERGREEEKKETYECGIL
jgi:poly(A) polymerase Pap1